MIGALAVGVLRDIRLGPDVFEYMHRIEATFEPFGGAWLVHGATPTVLEGRFDADLVVIGFPDVAAANDWYRSPAYAAILPLRTAHADADVVIVPTVAPGYRAETTVVALQGRSG